MRFIVCGDYMVVDEDVRRKSFDQRKKELRSLYKKYKVGLVRQEDLSDDELFLLTKYYPVKFERDDV